ncbi:MAG TPA: MarR family transcriptional regulator [Mycobacteriales bacterium]
MSDPAVVVPALTDADFQRLLKFRMTLRRFERWSDEQVAAQGLTPAWHQLMLAVRGHQDPDGPTIGDIADALLVRPHSAVELCNRVQRAGFITRNADPRDGRIVRIQLTDEGTRAVESLSRLHLEQLRLFARTLDQVMAGSASSPPE